MATSVLGASSSFSSFSSSAADLMGFVLSSEVGPSARERCKVVIIKVTDVKSCTPHSVLYKGLNMVLAQNSLPAFLRQDQYVLCADRAQWMDSRALMEKNILQLKQL